MTFWENVSKDWNETAVLFSKIRIKVIWIYEFLQWNNWYSTTLIGKLKAKFKEMKISYCEGKN